MIYLAYELKAKFDAGLFLCGQNQDGELEWIGTRQQEDKAEALEAQYAENGYDH